MKPRVFIVFLIAFLLFSAVVFSEIRETKDTTGNWEKTKQSTRRGGTASTAEPQTTCSGQCKAWLGKKVESKCSATKPAEGWQKVWNNENAEWHKNVCGFGKWCWCKLRKKEERKESETTELNCSNSDLENKKKLTITMQNTKRGYASLRVEKASSFDSAVKGRKFRIYVWRSNSKDCFIKTERIANKKGCYANKIYDFSAEDQIVDDFKGTEKQQNTAADFPVNVWYEIISHVSGCRGSREEQIRCIETGTMESKGNVCVVIKSREIGKEIPLPKEDGQYTYCAGIDFTDSSEEQPCHVRPDLGELWGMLTINVKDGRIVEEEEAEKIDLKFTKLFKLVDNKFQLLESELGISYNFGNPAAFRLQIENFDDQRAIFVGIDVNCPDKIDLNKVKALLSDKQNNALFFSSDNESFWYKLGRTLATIPNWVKEKLSRAYAYSAEALKEFKEGFASVGSNVAVSEEAEQGQILGETEEQAFVLLAKNGYTSNTLYIAPPYFSKDKPLYWQIEKIDSKDVSRLTGAKQFVACQYSDNGKLIGNAELTINFIQAQPIIPEECATCFNILQCMACIDKERFVSMLFSIETTQIENSSEQQEFD
ncbi:MAG: hypothetical protein J7L14_01695 [Candidatus Diapherotrites archaeon]|nr:hypothetical protein [Candidatus Diapherotrites archaeon]